MGKRGQTETGERTRTEVAIERHSVRVIGDRFQLLALAGTGGMGTVYRAVDLFDGRSIALKLLSSRSETFAARFDREVAVLAALAHPAIVRYVAHGVTALGERYLAMEWLDGETLKARLARGPLSPLDTAALGRDVLRALAATHARDIIHRDIKPANLFLSSPDARVKVLDFGIALTDDAQLTAPGAAIGTPAYMAPEQARAIEGVDGRADLFSLGCVLFECLTAAPLFTGNSAPAVLANVCADESGIGDRLDHVPPSLARLLRRMLKKQVELRTVTAADLAEEFADLVLSFAAQSSGASPAPSVPRALPAGEQRIISVVIAAFDTADEAVEVANLQAVHAAWSGTGLCIEPLAGGSLIAYLGNPLPPPDQAVKAARAALLLRAAVPGARVAIATGRGVIRAAGPAGEINDRARELLLASPAGAIAVDDVTAGLLGTRFDLTPDRPALLHSETQDAALPRTVLGKRTPCIGRDRELATLEGLYDESTNEPVARVVLVTAPAGSGKSRLTHELLERLQNRGEEFACLIGRGDSLRSGAPLGLLGPALRAAAGISGAEKEETQRKRLFAHATRHLQGDQGKRVAAFLGEMAGVHFPDDDLPALHAARQDPRLMADQMLAAWLDWLEAECAARPVVLVLEDLHWGDAPSVQFVDAALRTLREKPLLVMALARPEVDEKFSGLWGERDLQRISLAPLTKKSCAKLVQHVLGDLPPHRLAWIIERADGNPFYLEELVRAAAGGADLSSGSLPETVIGMVQIRFDALGSDAKKVLRAASVFGQTFRSGGVEALLGDVGADVDQWLEILAQKEVLFPRPAGDTQEFVFRHALLRDAAYDMLATPDRAVSHKRAGEWLEEAGEREAIVLVEHFERGGELKKAAHWSRFAAEQALEANDLGAAIDRVSRGVRAGASGEVLGYLRLVEAQARVWRGEYRDAEDAGAESTNLLQGYARWRAIAELATALGGQAKFVHIEPLAREILESAEGLPFDDLTAGAWVKIAPWLLLSGNEALSDAVVAAAERHAHSPDTILSARLDEVKALKCCHAGDHALAISYYHSAVAAYEKAGDLRSACKLLGNLATTLGDVGLLEEAEGTFRRALETAERHSINRVSLGVVLNLSQVLMHLGRTDEARGAAERSLSLAREQGDSRYEACAELYLALIHVKSGRPAEAVVCAGDALETLRGVRPLLPFALGVSARSLLANGDLDEALISARHAAIALEQIGAVEEGEGLVRLVLAECLEAAGDQVGAHDAIRMAANRLNTRAAEIPDIGWRTAFLTAIPDHARTIALAHGYGVTSLVGI